jgi:hypothetical protein
LAVGCSRWFLRFAGLPGGQRLRRYIGVAFAGKTAQAHPQEEGGAGHEHRNQAQQRRQQGLAWRGDATPVWAGMCSGHGGSIRPARGGAGEKSGIYFIALNSLERFPTQQGKP